MPLTFNNSCWNIVVEVTCNNFQRLASKACHMPFLVNGVIMSDGQLKIEKWDTVRDGALTEENMKKKLHSQGYNFIMYEFGPGTNFPDHTHSVSKKDSILSGRFQFGMHGQTVVLEPGDMIQVPKNTVHNAKVVGSQSVIFFDATK